MSSKGSNASDKKKDALDKARDALDKIKESLAKSKAENAELKKKIKLTRFATEVQKSNIGLFLHGDKINEIFDMMAEDLDIYEFDFEKKMNRVLEEKDNELVKIFLSDFQNEDELADYKQAVVALNKTRKNCCNKVFDELEVEKLFKCLKFFSGEPLKK